jgi:hypothetical protein
VPDAIRGALELAVRIEAAMNTPKLLAPRPRIYTAKGNWLVIRPAAMSQLLSSPSK